MKKTNRRLSSLFEAYAFACGNSGKSVVIKNARKVLSDRCYIEFMNKCIEFEYQELALIEGRLGLSGVQNKDNL